MAENQPAGDCFVVEGGRTVEGSLTPAGNKNEALPTLAATLLAHGESVLENLPVIRDVTTLVEMLADLGVETRSEDGGHTLHVDTAEMATRTPSRDLARTIRGSFLLAPGLLARTGRAVLPRPGGDRIGRRRIDTHLMALRLLGARVETRERQYHLELDGRFQGPTSSWTSRA